MSHLISSPMTIIIKILQLMVYILVGDTLLNNSKVLGANNSTAITSTGRYLFPKQNLNGKNDNGSHQIVCEDFRPNCETFKVLCNKTTFELIMKQDCQRSCGYCNETLEIINNKTEKVVDREFELLPNIQSISTNSDLRGSTASSLSKTIIKGTCFDEYIYCAEFTAMCEFGEYQDLMARHCSLSCGKCEVQHKERETCQDYVECEGYKSLCNHSVYRDLLKKQCRRTCEYCISESDECKDRHKNCQGFKDDGFCENPIYSIEERSYLCGKTCQFC